MRRYYRNSYYTPGNQKDLYYGNKIILISHLENLDLDELIIQKDIYTEQANNIDSYFNGSLFKKTEEEIEAHGKNLKIHLNKLIKEIKIVGDKKFYKIEKRYFEEKKIFKKNYVRAHIIYHAKNEDKGKEFLDISESIFNELNEIRNKTKIFNDKYKILKEIFLSHELMDNYDEKNDVTDVSIKSLNNEDLKILNIRYGIYFETSDSKDDFYLTYNISKKIPKFFLNSMLDDTNDYKDYGDWVEDQLVDFKPDFMIDDKDYYNESKFMKKFLKLSDQFNLPQKKIHNIARKTIALKITEKFIRRIELAIRAKRKNEEKMTNIGYVYILSNKAYPNNYKIGSTYKLPEERAEQLTGTGHLYPFIVEAQLKIKSAEYFEKLIHKFLKKHRVGKEYFKINLSVAKNILKKISKLSKKGEIKLDLMDLNNNIGL